MNVIVWLEFDLAYFEAAVQYFSHHTIGTSPSISKLKAIHDDIDDSV